MKRIKVLLCIIIPIQVVSQEAITSVALCYQMPYFQFEHYNTTCVQPPLKSYRAGLIISHKFKINMGLESQISFHSDKIKQTYSPYLPMSYDIKETTYTFNYLTISQGINYSIKLNKKFHFIVQTNFRLDTPLKKQMIRERYDGVIIGPSRLPEKSDRNGIVFSKEIELALKYQFCEKVHLQIAPMYSHYTYGKEYAEDAQIRSVFSIELSAGYSF